MKKQLVIALISTFVGAGTLSSCSDYLDVENVLSQTETIDSLFSKREGVEKLLANIYSYIPEHVNGMIYDVVWNGASDELDMLYKQAPSLKVKFGNYGPDDFANQGWINYWTFSYRAIRAANVFMNRVESCSDSRISKAKLTEYKNEARFLRSYYYLLLLQQYGPVILVPNDPIDIETPSDKLPNLRSPIDECVEYIASELTACEDLLPVSYEDPTDFGRPTQGAAMALKARLRLYAASPLYNGNTDYADFVREADGVNLISQTVDKNKWKVAADAAKAVIDLAEGGVYNLHTVSRSSETLPLAKTLVDVKDYPEGPGGIDAFRSYRELFCGNNEDKWVTKEIIWARPTGDPGTFVRHLSPYGLGNGDWGGMAVGQGLVDAFFMNDGRTTEQAHKEGDYRETLEASSAATNTEPMIPAGTNIRYLNREPRFYATAAYQGTRYKQKSGKGTYYQIDFMGKDTKNTDMYSSTGVMLRKFADIENENWADGVRHRGCILFRLGEVYLNYAEALNEYEPGNPDIKKYLNRIRFRGGIPGYSDTDLVNQDKVRELIHHERRIELSFEMHRYFDSRRWKEAGLTTKDYWGNSQGQGGDQYGLGMGAKTPVEFYKRVFIEKRMFVKRSYLWPIPTAEITNNPLLDQNPGW